jgi:uncharacterized DUF497 family protein
VGTHEYELELEDQEGMVIWTDTHFIWVLSNKDRKPFQGDQPTESEKAEGFSSAVADGGSYKHVDDSLAWTYPDPAHSDSEQRWITMGFSGEQRLIFVAHTDRNDKVRIISVRQATRKEQRFYEEG